MVLPGVRQLTLTQCMLASRSSRNGLRARCIQGEKNVNYHTTECLKYTIQMKIVVFFISISKILEPGCIRHAFKVMFLFSRD